MINADELTRSMSEVGHNGLKRERVCVNGKEYVVDIINHEGRYKIAVVPVEIAKFDEMDFLQPDEYIPVEFGNLVLDKISQWEKIRTASKKSDFADNAEPTIKEK